MKNQYISDLRMAETSRTSPENLLDNAPLASQIRNDMVKLVTDSTVLKSSTVDTVTTSGLLNTQYINIHRVSDMSTKSLQETSLSLAQQAVLNRELLAAHNVVHNGMVVDMMVPTTADYVTQSSGQYYDTEEDLLTTALTEEDRTLAAALVAVQLVQQQKQSNVIVSAGGLPALPLTSGIPSLASITSVPDVTKPSVSTMVSSYMQAVQEETQILESTQCERDISKLYQSHVLPPLKKVLSSHPHLPPKSRYMRPYLHSKQDLGLRLETEPRISLTDHSPVHPLELCDVKSEGDGDDSDDIFMDDSDDSDYNIENDLKASRKSLPHKKRIPRKLKNIKKSNSSVENARLKCGKCGQRLANHAEFSKHILTHNVAPKKSIFNCELCTKSFNNQLKFFEHLKSHYEPASVTSVSSITTPTMETIDTTVTSITPVKVNDPTRKNEHVQIICETVMPKDHITIDNISRLPVDNISPTIPSSPPTYTCTHCGKIFRRQKAYETHVNIVHPKHIDIEEFSEPEDLMEGIRSVVEGGVGETGDEADIDCLSSSIKNSIEEKVKLWYREEDLHAAEVDLQEMEEQQKQQENQQQCQVERNIQHEESEPQLPSEEDNICEICGDIYESTEALSDHLNEKHSDLVSGSGTVKDTQIIIPVRRRAASKRDKKSPAQLLSCPDCGRMFNHRNSLVYHMRSHSGERPHQCEVCGKSFFAASALKVHMRLHSGDKPYKCELCDRLFRQWGDLKYHCISIHSEEKNFQCEYCGKDFARKYSLIVHRRIHTGEKNYKCEFCSKSFRASSYLQNHRRIHTGEKPHPCEVCGKPFRVRSDMKRHLNTHTRHGGRVIHRASNISSTYLSNSLVQITTKVELKDSADDRLNRDEDSQSRGTSEDSKLGIVHSDSSSLSSLHTVEQPSMPDLHPVTEITIDAEGDTILPEERQPINLNLSRPLSQTLSPSITEQVFYTRDPLENAKDGTSTLYVWPIYMA